MRAEVLENLSGDAWLPPALRPVQG